MGGSGTRANLPRACGLVCKHIMFQIAIRVPGNEREERWGNKYTLQYCPLQQLMHVSMDEIVSHWYALLWFFIGVLLGTINFY